MRSVAEHTRLVRALVDPVLARLAAGAPEHLPVGSPGLPGRVAAADLLAGEPLPPFDNSQMDGYAVRSADLAGAGDAPAELRIGRATAAGDPPLPHEPGTASPVMTGAAVPAGADAVIPIERADPPRFTELRRAGDPAPAGVVRFAAPPEPGAFVRPRGSDLRAGDRLVSAGDRLTPARIGLLAGAGVAVVPVRRRPRVLLVTTGDELAGPGAPLAPGAIHDANTPLLAAALREAGAEVTPERVPDRPEALRRLLRERGAEHELLVTSGGISAGAFEVVRDALADRGAEFASLALQPGGPQGCGLVRAEGPEGPAIPALCFPGNPVSSALSAELFLLPLLRAYAGRPAGLPVERRPLAHDVESPPHKHQIRRGGLDADGRVRVTPPGSHLLADLASAEVLVHIPAGVARLAAGSPVELWRLDV